MNSSRGNYIENEAAYEAAIERRIRENARKGKRNRWLAENPERLAMIHRMIQDLNSARPNAFIAKMYDSYEEWGTLTAGQEAAVLKVWARDAERLVERAAQRKAEGAISTHIGTVGERRDFTLSVTFETSFETQFGTLYVLGLKDAAGNVVIYKGSAPFAAKGETVTVKATVKEHGERDGVKQTIIARPKLSA